jgi:membrane protease YdiL (CAAX protease family)
MQQRHSPRSITLLFAAIMPTLAVSIGLHLLHNAWIAIFLYHAGMLGFMAGDRQLRPIAQRLKAGFALYPFLALSAFCMFSGVLIYMLWPWMYTSTTPFNIRLAQYSMGPASYVPFVLYFSLIHPVIEESYWRGWFAHRGQALSPILQDLAFAAFHVSVVIIFITPAWTLVAFMVLATMGSTWRAVERRFKGLSMPILSHAAADFTIIVAGFLLAQTT